MLEEVLIAYAGTLHQSQNLMSGGMLAGARREEETPVWLLGSHSGPA